MPIFVPIVKSLTIVVAYPHIQNAINTNSKTMLICNGEMILDYSDVLDKKISDLNGEAFEILDDYIWDNTLSPKETFLG